MNLTQKGSHRSSVKMTKNDNSASVFGPLKIINIMPRTKEQALYVRQVIIVGGMCHYFDLVGSIFGSLH